MFISRSVSRIAEFAEFFCLLKFVANVAQSFSIYIPYADTTIFNIDDEHCAVTICVHCALTALNKLSPVRFAMFAPFAKSVVAQIDFMSPPASNVPAVDNDFDFVFDKTSPIALNCCADADLSFVRDNVCSPVDADVMAATSAADLLIMSKFKS